MKRHEEMEKEGREALDKHRLHRIAKLTALTAPITWPDLEADGWRLLEEGDGDWVLLKEGTTHDVTLMLTAADETAAKQHVVEFVNAFRSILKKGADDA